jgi:hypothetical protein
VNFVAFLHSNADSQQAGQGCEGERWRSFKGHWLETPLTLLGVKPAAAVVREGLNVDLGLTCSLRVGSDHYRVSPWNTAAWLPNHRAGQGGQGQNPLWATYSANTCLLHPVFSRRV